MATQSWIQCHTDIRKYFHEIWELSSFEGINAKLSHASTLPTELFWKKRGFSLTVGCRRKSSRLDWHRPSQFSQPPCWKHTERLFSAVWVQKWSWPLGVKPYEKQSNSVCAQRQNIRLQKHVISLSVAWTLDQLLHIDFLLLRCCLFLCVSIAVRMPRVNAEWGNDTGKKKKSSLVHLYYFLFVFSPHFCGAVDCAAPHLHSERHRMAKRYGQKLSGRATASQANTAPCVGPKKSFLSSG